MQMTQIKKEMKQQASSGKKDSSVRHVSYHLNRKIPKSKGKNPDKLCRLIFLKINQQLQKQRHKVRLHIYLLGMSCHFQLHI